METLLTAALEREIEAAQGETISLLKALCAIPAPSHHEERRAEWIQAWLKSEGRPLKLTMRKTFDVVSAYLNIRISSSSWRTSIRYSPIFSPCRCARRLEDCIVRASLMTRQTWRAC